MKRISPIIICILFFASCKKTKLEGDLSFFVGTWEWQYTVKINDVCDASAPDSVVINSPSIAGFSYQIQIEKKGFITTKKNNKKISKDRLVYDFDKEYGYGGRLYVFKLNNGKKKQIELISAMGKILTSTYPEEAFEEENNGCFTRYSVFEKVE